jgi:hypothetical protein
VVKGELRLLGRGGRELLNDEAVAVEWSQGKAEPGKWGGLDRPHPEKVGS